MESNRLSGRKGDRKVNVVYLVFVTLLQRYSQVSNCENESP